MEEKLGKTIIDGEIIDLNNLSSEELEKKIKKLEDEEQKLENKIEKILSE